MPFIELTERTSHMDNYGNISRGLSPFCANISSILTFGDGYVCIDNIIVDVLETKERIKQLIKEAENAK